MPPNHAHADNHGRTVAIQGDTIVVGAPHHNDAGIDNGSVFVYGRDTGGADNWGLVKQLNAFDPDTLDSYGFELALDDDTLAVYRSFDDVYLFEEGSIYIYERDLGGPDNWGFVQKLAQPDPVEDAVFGIHLALDGDTLIAGAPGDIVDDVPAAGSAYVYRRNQAGSWTNVAKLLARASVQLAWVGYAVTVQDQTLIVGAPRDDGTEPGSGTVYRFEIDAIFTDGFESGDLAAWSTIVP